ncbi:cytochrome ubiquinol oxidase subunit I [Hyphobacterium sp. SN044]|uniref:cytochrome ubiquinol oxidase subunit I n=1 Tax=Hyphobacterium sp. SN044 TaxID=2912575 RepID=UPI001F426412|nr:cytochrome ubiquinol oxidase subunit I [Hyphobacterium sp. SN044]MCF8878483.1 cytochrome ubiquinol oxidase subunit I [Hyphobacterium sp. SN044]
MEFDALLLSRLQFAFTIAFHIIFPSFTIGLASFLAVLEGLHLFTKRESFRTLYRFWVKVFALAFGMGVVSGVVMSYQFGTNWSVFADQTGSVLGPLLGYEVLTAFFLEASFLGIMLFGWKLVGPRLHFASTVIVAVGTLVSAFWILSANSWMQTPQGFTMEDGRFVATSWMEVIFNPSFPSRFAHMVTAAYLTTALVVLATAGWQWIRKRPGEEVTIMARMAILTIAILAPAQLLIGHESGKVAHEYQPAKVAAMEGWWETRPGQPTLLFAWPDQENETNHLEIGIPGFGSWVVAGDASAELEGLDAFAAEDRPPVFITFWAFRVMVGLGMLMIALGFWGAWTWWRGTTHKATLLHWAALAMGPSGFIAILAGWVTAEVGRQPFVVYGVLRTADAVSPVEAGQVATSLLVFMVTYAIVFSAGALFILRILGNGPIAEGREDPEPDGAPGDALSVGVKED